MNASGIATLIIFVVAIIMQACKPNQRLLIVLVGSASCTFLAVTSGTIDMIDLWKEIPWNVIAILVFLSLFTQSILPSNVLGYIAVRACALSQGQEIKLLIIFPSLIFLLSAVVNNLTAMLVVMSILLSVMKVLSPQQRFSNMLLSLLLVSCNLGGCSSPVGDFPAVLLLGGGKIAFVNYLISAGIICIVIFLVVLLTFIIWYYAVIKRQTPLFEQNFSVAIIHKLYRRTKIRWRILIPAAIVFAGMVVAWIIGFAPDFVAFIGIAILLLCGGVNGEDVIKKGVDIEPILFIIGLLVMVVTINATGVLNTIAAPIFNLSSSPKLMFCLFLGLSGVLTGIFSAGPSMAALLPLADKLTDFIPSNVVYVSLALSVCAGSSLFLTAATSGPLSQYQVETATIINEDEKMLRFSFFGFLPYGIVSFLIILSGAILFALIFS